MTHFLAGVAGGATVALLNDQKQPNVINNYYALSKEQAELYMQTDKYKHYLDIMLTNCLYYKSKEGKFKYFYWVDSKTNKIRYPNDKEFNENKQKLEKEFREKHLVILQTEGISKLPKHDGNWKEITTCDKIRCCCMCIFWCSFLCSDNPDAYCSYICPETATCDSSVPYVKAAIVSEITGKVAGYIKKRAFINPDNCDGDNG